MNNTDKHRIVNIRYDFLVCLFLVIAILAVYWQMNYHEFTNFDDSLYILQNQHVKKGLTSESISWAFGFVDIAYWHPLTWLSHMLDCQIYGLIPGMHHRTSLIFHIVNSILLFFVLQKMTGALWKSAFVAALFALHPINVESVAWVVQRKNTLSTFFWMLTMLAYVYYTRHPNLYRYFLTLLLLMLGLMAKPMLVTLPFVLLLLDYWPLGRLRQQSTFNLILEKIPFFALSAVSAYISSISVQRYGIVVSMELVPMKLRLANALVSYVKYIEKMIWPKNLAVFYPFPDTLPIWQVFGAGLLLVSISFLVLLNFRKKPYLCIGWLWFLGTLIPVIGLKQAGLWPAVADRWAYVPLIGLFIIVVWGISDISSRWRKQNILLPLLSSIIFVSLMICTYFQIHHWKNSITLFTHALNVTSNNYIAHGNVGQALDMQGQFDEAIQHYYKALEINPNYVDAHNNLGVALARKGDVKNAINHYYRALQINPAKAKAHNNLGVALSRQGNDKAAIYHYNEALRINSDYAGAYYNLGKIFANQGKTENAILHFHKALQKDPDMTQALYNLSWIGATSEDDKFRNGIEAIKLAEKLCKLQNYSQPLSLDALAAAYAEAGRFKEAVLTAQKALKLALLSGPEELALGLQKRLKLYQAKRPFRQILRRKNES
ncbi:MAG: tetratricopeptide repeat protein [Desulfobacteraceae bacterium]|nr:tetratricopeptide repeat protein [Desulfobacteraceae bacterium]